MGSRRTARVLAPLALVASALAVYVIVRPADSGGGSDEPATTTTVRTGTTSNTGTTTTARRSGPASVAIQPGDTLSAIAERTGVSVARLEELNEDVDAQALRAGDRLRLRP